VKERIAADRVKVQERIARWTSIEEVCTRVGLDDDAAYCAYIRSHLDELLDCLGAMERVTA
jgi:hypothetical protein